MSYYRRGGGYGFRYYHLIAAAFLVIAVIRLLYGNGILR